jgi:hypothetical protein
MSGQELPPLYNFAFVSDRSANYLSHCYGFENPQALAAEIPPNGAVLDVGAGRSPLGRVVAACRPDITWTNFDQYYRDEKVVQELSAIAPANVKHVAGDILNPPSFISDQTWHRLYSYWMFPYLSLEEREPAHRAALMMLTLADKDEGIVRAGPTPILEHFPKVRTRSTEIVRSPEDTSDVLNAYAEHILGTVHISGFGRACQRIESRRVRHRSLAKDATVALLN